MLVCLSLDHQRVELDLLGRIEQHTEPLADALADPALSSGSVVLATCNRFEAYLDVPNLACVESALQQLARVTAVEQRELREVTRIHAGLEAAEHLFSVTGGLESVVIGEGEIAGQVRRALERSRASGSVSSELERLFQFAARTSRQIKSRTGVQTAGRSLVRLALMMAQSRVGDWATTNVVLVGTGMYAGANLAALRARGAANVSVYSPSGRAQEFAQAHGIRAIHHSDLDRALAAADLIITASLAREPILLPDLFNRTRNRGRAPYCDSLRGKTVAESPVFRPRLVIDLGLPRNVHPSVASISGVELLDLDTIAKHSPIEELSAVVEAKEIVRDAVAEFAALNAERDAVPALVALREHVNEILDGELQRLGLSADDSGDMPATRAHNHAELEAALRHFAGRLLHTPSLRVRELGRAGESDRVFTAVEALFGIDLTESGK